WLSSKGSPGTPAPSTGGSPRGGAIEEPGPPERPEGGRSVLRDEVRPGVERAEARHPGAGDERDADPSYAQPRRCRECGRRDGDRAFRPYADGLRPEWA